jgi:hypothetical protein
MDWHPINLKLEGRRYAMVILREDVLLLLKKKEEEEG